MTEATRQSPAPTRGRGRVLPPLALALLCLLAVAAYIFEQRARHPAPQTSPVAAAPALPGSAAPASAAPASASSGAAASAGLATAPQPATPQPAAPQPAAPNIDVVRVDKDGNLVMAGRAKPGETLAIHNGQQALGTVTADAEGQWVFLPETPLSPGAHQLTVAAPGVPATDKEDSTEVLLGLPKAGAGATSATATVPGQTLESGPLVVLSQGTAPPRLLATPPGSTPGPVGLDIVQYGEQGQIRFTGHAKPGSTVRLYVDNKPVGEAKANPQGQWSLTPKAALAPGVHALRTDELAAGGRVEARSEVPFARADLAAALKAGQDIVQPGDCLWTIARHSYGHGIAYTAIFQANRSQIRDPDLIYPGQVLTVPPGPAATSNP
ncbi:LysM peptidoglycan-binding domain-containing protein [Acidisoma sp. C75]